MERCCVFLSWNCILRIEYFSVFQDFAPETPFAGSGACHLFCPQALTNFCVNLYLMILLYFYGGKEQLWAIDSKTLSQKTKLLFPLKIWVPTHLFCPQALGLKSRQGILWLRFWKSYLQEMLFLHFCILYLQGIIDLRWDYRLGKEYYNCTFPQELWAPQYDQLDFSATTTTLTSTSIVEKDSYISNW